MDLVAALNMIGNVKTDGKANYGDYATLPTCLNKVKETLRNHNLAVMQLTYTEPDRVVTRLVHTEGEYIEDGGVPLICDNKSNPQKMGSAIAYARRYGLMALVGSAGTDEDDDGQAATPVDELPDTKGHSTSHSNTPAPKPEPKPQPVVVENIEDTMGIRVPDDPWVAQQIVGFVHHRHLGEHNDWKDVNADTLQGLTAADYEQIGKAWQARKKSLLNE